MVARVQLATNSRLQWTSDRPARPGSGATAHTTLSNKRPRSKQEAGMAAATEQAPMGAAHGALAVWVHNRPSARPRHAVAANHRRRLRHLAELLSVSGLSPD